MNLQSLVRVLGLSVACASSSLANGGPWVTGVAGTGSAAPGESAAKSDVTIEEEKLTIDLHQDFAEVEVRYRMRNTGPAVDQPFFFPVDVQGRLREPQQYVIEVDGNALASEAWGKPAPTERMDPFVDAVAKPIRYWRRSTIPFRKEQVREVVIRYRVEHFVAGESFSDDTKSGPAKFLYALSPAAGWKEPIGLGTVVINVRSAIPERVVVEKPKGRFTSDGPRRWVWQFNALRPTLDDDIKIRVAPGYEHYPGPNPDSPQAGQVRYVAEEGKYYLRHADFDISASSELHSEKPGEYSAENVKHGYPKPWAEGVDGDGIGESLEIKVRHPRPLAAILVGPGYDDPKHPEYWGANNRVAEFEITLNGERTFRTSIPDEKFRDLYPIAIRGYDKLVRTVKMVITEVHRGTQFRDTCVSRVRLLAKLTKKPKVSRK